MNFYTFDDTVEEEVYSHIAYYIVAFFLKITDARPHGADNTGLLHVILSVT